MPASRTASAQSRPRTAQSSGRHQELVFDGSVSLAVTLEASELPAGSDKSIECYYIQAPRNSYLPLLLPELRKHLIEVVLDESSAAAVKDESLWLETNGEAWKWHWPIGLLYDYHIASTASTSKAHDLPLKVTLHLANPPSDKLPIGPSIEACRSNFMNMIKEADFVRWGSTRRVTGLRKAEQDALWEAVVEHDFDKYWAVASKLLPPPSAPGSFVAPVLRDVSADNKLPEANAMRSVPLRIYLPLGIPALQDVVPPVSAEGQPLLLYDVLSSQIPLVFPPRSHDMTASFLASRPLASVIIHGIFVPMDVEVGWLGAVMAGADGWVAVMVMPL